MVSSQTSVAELVGALPELGRTRVPNPSRSTDARRGYGIVVLIIVLLIGMFVSVAIGIRAIPLASTWDAVFSFDPANSDHLLVRHQRVPRALLSGFVGVCLGVAGAVMQALTRNPLAEPGILGVNSGAAVAIAIGISFLGIVDVRGYMWLGLIGAAVAGVAVFFLGGVRRGVNPVRLVLAGAALSVVLGALTHIVLVNSVDDVFDRYRHWMVGSVAGRGYEVLLPVGFLGAVGLVMALALTRALDSAMLRGGPEPLLGWQPGQSVVTCRTGGDHPRGSRDGSRGADHLSRSCLPARRAPARRCHSPVGAAVFGAHRRSAYRECRYSRTCDPADGRSERGKHGGDPRRAVLRCPRAP